MTTNHGHDDRYNWWASLKHGGLLIAPSKLAEFFPENIDPLANYLIDRLRRDLVRVLDGDDKHLPVLLDTVLEDVLGLAKAHWSKGNAVDTKWSHKAITQENIKPRRIWLGPNDSFLPVFVGDAALGMGKQSDSLSRLGVGRGRRAVSRVIEWLRRANQKIALLTNGRQWRLIHAGADYDAWSEWDINLWFQEGAPGEQVTALRLLLGSEALQSASIDKPSPLIAAIQASRKGQAELSSMLGERVRQAVEHLISVSSSVLDPLDEQGPNHVERRDIYIAATRIIMRCVVVLFAEARELLPRDNAIYNDSYGIQGLREQLDRFAGGKASERLRYSHSAWPRLISLFRLVYFGSAHESLPIPGYGGGLFVPGDANSTDAILRTLAAFENPSNAPSDAAVHKILELLCRSKVKIRQGRGSTWVEAPVDFSDLSSEYIGILYEGLLDYELRRAPVDDPMLFLNLGDQPVLPFSRLDGMANKDLTQLLEKLKQKSKGAVLDEEESNDEAAEELESNEIDSEIDEPIDSPMEVDEFADVSSADDMTRAQREMIQTWAERAVKAAKLVKYPRDDSDLRVREAFNQEVTRTAKTLYQRIVLPGEWFLVRWGGTRKGSGTFYTRPQLAVPTTRRTIQPLAYEAVSQTTDEKTGIVTVTEWSPKRPEEILALKVCDPAMGSGSFLIAALRYLVEALIESLHAYGRLESDANRTICRLADGLPADHPSQETLPVPKDDPEFDDRLRSRLKRHIVERCLYGVDLDPLAVELARMALWIETMDTRLPFGFLDHKLKCGNSLVGCWFDRFQDYPVMAWEREGGDKNHERFVHHFRESIVTKGKKKGEKVQSGDKWTQAIKDIRNEVIKHALKEWITVKQGAVFPFMREGYTVESIHNEALAVFEELHSLPVHETEKRADLYREKILNDSGFQGLKEAFDTWCAIWFWPGDKLNIVPTPQTFLQPSNETRNVVAKLVNQHQFFHWEIEFPDVFTGPNSGFNAVIGNPPWENAQPNPSEFFSNIEPLFRTFGRLEMYKWQQELFRRDKEQEYKWILYNSMFKAFSNWVSHAADPFGVGLFEQHHYLKGISDQLRLSWKDELLKRNGYIDPNHPFQLQTGRIFTYKLFLEQSLRLLQKGGRMGMIVPSGISTDSWSAPLREYFIKNCKWEWLFGFINWNKIFQSIYYRFKFSIIIVEKGEKTDKIKASFSRYVIEEWEEAERYILSYSREQIEQFSPKSKLIMETRSERDLQVLEKLYSHSIVLGNNSPDGWGITYALEFMMNIGVERFPPRLQWEERGYRPDEYGHWLKGNWYPYDGSPSIVTRPKDLIISSDGTSAIKVNEIEDVALPFYEGRMIGQFDFSQKGWVSGKGRRAIWREIAWNSKIIEPQYCMGIADFIGSKSSNEESKVIHGTKIAFMDIASATNARTMVATVLKNQPCGNSAAVLSVRDSVLELTAILNSFVYDYIVRARCGGLHLNYFVIDETAVLRPRQLTSLLRFSAARLAISSINFAVDWLCLRAELPNEYQLKSAWKHLWAITSHERLRLRCIIDAVITQLYGLDIEDFKWILQECDHPVNIVRSSDFMRTLDPKGFWRVDKETDPELRHTILSLVAFYELKRIGLDAFLSLNDGEGWMIPETLRLADYGLGHDDRAKEHQPVVSRMGPRFLPWQLEQSPAESWEECERHAELIAKIVPPMPEPTKPNPEEQKEQAVDLFGNPLPTDLFGNVIYPSSKKKTR